MPRRIFIIDDEPDMVKIAAELLRSDGFLVDSDTHAPSGLKKIRTHPPDLLLLDVRMPDIDGLQICKQLKSDPKTANIPVIMVSVKADESDVVLGLEFGAEDYISKPFRRRELLARVKTILRRMDIDLKGQRLQLGPIEVDYCGYVASVDGRPISLTPKEFELLGFFLKREGRVLTRCAISENVWGTEFTNSTRTIDVHVDQVRKKLGKYRHFIHSLKGIGYRFEVDE